MKRFEVEQDIVAQAPTIWRVLVDAETLLSEDFGIIQLDGQIAPGERLRLKSEVDPKRAFTLRVTEFVPGERMVWRGGMPLNLFSGIRLFQLTPKDGVTRFLMRESYAGLMAPLIVKSIPDLTASFEKFADRLKQVAEDASPPDRAASDASANYSELGQQPEDSRGDASSVFTPT